MRSLPGLLLELVLLLPVRLPLLPLFLRGSQVLPVRLSHLLEVGLLRLARLLKLLVARTVGIRLDAGRRERDVRAAGLLDRAAGVRARGHYEARSQRQPPDTLAVAHDDLSSLR